MEQTYIPPLAEEVAEYNLVKPLNEPIIRNDLPDPYSWISKNNHGLAILNTENIVIVDIDETGDDVLGRFREHARLMGSHWRVYRTAKGFRAFLMNETYGPYDPRFEAAVRVLKVDWLYARLCQRTGTYRARLEPKPARVLSPDGNYCVCHLIGEFGEPTMTQFWPRYYHILQLVHLHDSMTLGDPAQPLA